MKRLLSILLAALMMLSVISPALSVFAAEAAQQSAEDTPLIVCWGDLRTYCSSGGVTPSESYWAKLSQMTGFDAQAAGRGGETAITLAALQGGLDIKLKKDITIPASKSAVTLTSADFAAYFKDGTEAGQVVPRLNGAGGWNNVKINNIEGTITTVTGNNPTTGNKPESLTSLAFTRTAAGEATTVPAGTKIIPAGHALAQRADINIFYVGEYGGWNKSHSLPNDDEYQDLIDVIDSMIAATKPGSGYIVIGPVSFSTKTGNLNANPAGEKTTNALAEKYGNNFLNANAYLTSAQALTDAGITPTEDDLARISEKRVPASLLATDSANFNATGHSLLARKLYEKFIELGYYDIETNIDHIIAGTEYRDASALNTLITTNTTVDTENGVGGRKADDAAAKFTYTGPGSDCAATITIPAQDQAGVISATIDLYPNTNYQGLQFMTDGGAITDKIPASAFNLNKWNRIGLVYNSASSSSEVYVNGTLYATSTTAAAISGDVIKIVSSQDITSSIGESFYLDDIAFYSGLAIFPTIEDASSYTVVDKKIYDVAGDTVVTLTNNLTLSGYSVAVYGSDEAPKTGDAIIAAGDKIKITFNNIVIEEYSAEAAVPPAVETFSEAYNNLNLNFTPTYSSTDVVYGWGGKHISDASLQVDARSVDATNHYTKIANNFADAYTTPFVVTASVYPTSLAENIKFYIGNRALCDTITSAKFNVGEWNKLVLFHNPKTSKTRTFINGVEQAEFTATRLDTTKHYINLEINSPINTAGTIAYYDDIAVYTGNLVYPYITESDVTFDGIRVHGWGGKTVADFRNAVTLNASTYSINAVDPSGNVLADNAEIAADSTIQILCGNSVIDRYTPGIATHELIGEPTIYTNGYNDADNDKFGIGTATVKQKIGVFNGGMEVTAILAQYDADGYLTKIAIEPQTVVGSDEVVASIDIDSTDDTTLKFYIWDGTPGAPLCDPVEYVPYSASEIEMVVPLYEGYTTKSAVFNTDDGTWQEYMLLDLFEKYGIKGTFNFYTQINSTSELDARIDSQIAKAKAAGDADALAATDWIDYVQRAYINKGHEIATHSKTHFDTDATSDNAAYMSPDALIDDIGESIVKLEGWFGNDIVGIAWPNGYGQDRDDFDTLVPRLSDLGIKYTRAKETGTFDIPTDWYSWVPTCRYLNSLYGVATAPVWVDKFVALDNTGDMKCFFTWGHSADINDYGNTHPGENGWEIMEGVMKKLYDDDVWFATNAEIRDYVEATKLLDRTGTTVTNNSTMTVYCIINGQSVALEAGETFTIGE